MPEERTGAVDEDEMGCEGVRKAVFEYAEMFCAGLSVDSPALLFSNGSQLMDYVRRPARLPGDRWDANRHAFFW